MSRRVPRPAGRRISPRVRTTPAWSRPGLPGLGLTAAVVTVMVLVLAGLLPHAGTADTVGSGARRTAVGRDLVCVGDLAGARWRAGAVSPGPESALTANGAPVRMHGSAPLHAPVTVHADPPRADDAWAVQSARTSAWLAAASCPAPRAEWWFPGAGAGTRHHGVLELTDPREGDAIVDVEVLGPHGPIAAPGLRGVRVASGRTVRLALARVSAAYGDVAVHVTATRGLVSATVPEQWAARVVAAPVQEWVADQPEAARRLTLLGLGGRGTTATLVVANPSAREAVVGTELLTDGGVVAPKKAASLRVPPGTVRSVPFPDAAGAGALGVRLSSQVPVSAVVRSVRGRDEAYAVNAEPLGTGGVVGLPEHTRGRLVLAAGRAATATVTAYDTHGHVVGSREVSVPERGAASVAVPRAAVALRLTTHPADAVRAAVLLTAGNGLATEAVPAASTDAHVPDVVPLAP